MLKQRVITAVLLLAVLLPALFYPSPEPFCALALVMIVGGGWEWGRLNGCRSGVALAGGLALGGVLVALWWQVGLVSSQPWLWGLVSAVWLVLAVVLLRRGVSGWAGIPRALRLLAGWVLIGAAWWAMAQARYLGVEMLLSIFLLVWVADIAAYFGGKAFGRRKLAPQISPGKSWAGVYSGVLGVLVLGVGWVALRGAVPEHLYGHLWSLGWSVAALALLVLTGMSVAGDLIESLVKRSAGMKDSSGLLPGHGGVLDRVDALLPVLPMAMLVLSWH